MSRIPAWRLLNVEREVAVVDKAVIDGSVETVKRSLRSLSFFNAADGKDNGDFDMIATTKNCIKDG